MSSYYPSFNLMGLNSLKDKNLMVVHFESGDSDEMDTFLGMDQIYTEHPYGTKRLTYGAKYNNVAVIRISVMKINGQDFSMAETRDFLKWTTGARQNSYLDLVDGNTVKVSFLGHVTAVYQQKLDARTIGFIIEHTSVSPWGYSPIQTIRCAFGQDMSVDESGILSKDDDVLSVNNNGLLSNGHSAMFNVTNDGIIYVDNTVRLHADNLSDDLYTYVELDTKLTNTNSTNVTILNQTLYDASNGNDGETLISGIVANEVVTLSSGQFIASDSGRLFGNNFNFVWPKLMPGVNELYVSGDGCGFVEFTYRYPIKIGDCAMDINIYNNGLNCGDCPDIVATANPIFWEDILGIPSTISGYGITDAYTMSQVDKKIESVEPAIDEAALNKMLEETLN